MKTYTQAEIEAVMASTYRGLSGPAPEIDAIRFYTQTLHTALFGEIGPRGTSDTEGCQPEGGTENG